MDNQGDNRSLSKRPQIEHSCWSHRFSSSHQLAIPEAEYELEC